MGILEESVIGMELTKKQEELLAAVDVLYLDITREEFEMLEALEMVRMALTFYTNADLANEIGFTASYLSQISGGKVKLGKVADRRLREKMMRFYDNHEDLFRIISVSETIEKQKRNPFCKAYVKGLREKEEFDLDDLPF